MYFRATYINKNAMASYIKVLNDHKKGNKVVKNRHGPDWFHSVPFQIYQYLLIKFVSIHLRGFIAYLAPCNRLYQLNLLNSYCGYIYKATGVISKSVLGNITKSLFCCIPKPEVRAICIL